MSFSFTLISIVGLVNFAVLILLIGLIYYIRKNLKSTYCEDIIKYN